ncbi:MAG: cell envelope integrity protein CreD [Candidatus Azobacteroides sp.]|nr:cell envelope integrity protein CreD [Candidatus Azobacteroides sp.]
METKRKNDGKFSQSLTFKAMIIIVLTLLMLIPNMMIQNLILERKERSLEAINRINEKWSQAQTVCGPILTIPYITTGLDKDKKAWTQQHEIHITPENLNISAQLYPEERHYGIYKTILYKSEIHIDGQFAALNKLKIDNSTVQFDKAYLSLQISDLQGVTNQLVFHVNNQSYTAEIGTQANPRSMSLIVNLKDLIRPASEEPLHYECNLHLNGSGDLNFVPIGNMSKAEIEGAWKSPGFIGSFSPEYTLGDTSFTAKWSILSFNRNIPEKWNDNEVGYFDQASFGVNLVDVVDQYQQNMRSAKYSLMFIVLTFAVFFFVEVLTKKRIHPIQYLLVGIALILFYSLLLSLSEQINFAIAYLIASIATIALIAAYSSSIFQNRLQTGMLSLMLVILYVFLYVILQLEDVALLIGSIGLFVILGIIMYFSRKINWYRPEENEENENEEDSGENEIEEQFPDAEWK